MQCLEQTQSVPTTSTKRLDQRSWSINAPRVPALILVRPERSLHLAYAQSLGIAIVDTKHLSTTETKGKRVILDFDLNDDAMVERIKSHLAVDRPKELFILIDLQCPVEADRASALHPDKVLARGIPVAELRDVIAGAERDLIAATETVQAAGRLMKLFMESARTGGVLPSGDIDAVAKDIVSSMDGIPAPRWLDLVRAHHESTHQHCLLVTSVVTGWASRLGMSRSDLHLLTTAGLLHDIGKAFVPTVILDKPGRLNEAEMDIIRTHPLLGADYVSSFVEDPKILAVIRHHHEFLDGSGYPHGLAGSEVTDLMRFMTICDIYGALMERRSYKEPLPVAKAIEVLEAMVEQGKIDGDMTRSFREWALN